MLDTDLIALTNNHLNKSNSSKTSSSINGLYLIENFLPDKMLNKIHEYLISPDALWESADSYPNRYKINWQANTVIEELRISLNTLTSALNNEFSRNNTFIGLTLWKDLPGYSISKHIDNPVIDIAIQVYLSHIDYKLGTCFEKEEKQVNIDYKKNCGYLMDNQEKIIHYMIKPVPKNYTRYSLYAIWSNKL